MSCPPLFKDLHKKTDDAFSKDFKVGCFNSKIAHKYDMGNLGDGKATTKIDYATSNTNPKVELEWAHNMDQYLGLNLKGVKMTKTITSGSDLVQAKMEKNLGAGKLTCKWNQGLSNWLNLSKPDFSYDIGKDKFNTQLNIIPESNFKGLDSISLSTVAKTGPVNTGLKLNYNMPKSALNHHLKLTKACDGLNLTLGLENANNLELLISKNINKNVDLKLFNLNIDNIHSKTNYDIKSSNWNSDLCAEWSNSNVGSIGFSNGKCKLNLKDLTYHESATINVNDSLGATFAFKSTMDSDLFNNTKMGIALNFNL